MVCSAVEKYKETKLSKGYFCREVEHPDVGRGGLAQRSGVLVFRPLCALALAFPGMFAALQNFFVFHFPLLKLTEDHTWELKV